MDELITARVMMSRALSWTLSTTPSAASMTWMIPTMWQDFDGSLAVTDSKLTITIDPG